MIHDSAPLNVDTDSQDTSSFPPSYSASLALPPPPSPISRRTSLFHSPSRPPVEHVYSLFDSRNVPWASLKLLSNVGSPRFLPAYFEGQTMQGAVDLHLRKPETILGVIVTISGTIMAASAPEPRTFWELTHALWTAEAGDPRSPTQSSSPSTNSNASSTPSLWKGKNTSKLVGSYLWPFAITLPSTCTVAFRSKQPPATLPLPPSFSEKGASQFINYEITVRIRRGPLRIDSRLGTQFGFAPRTRPPAPPLLRQLTCQENRPLVDPECDPNVWTVLPPIFVRGKLFNVRLVEAVCTFALAKPLTYTRGHPLPVMLTIKCPDLQTLDLVFAPQNVSVHLIREVCYENGCPNASHRESSCSWGTGLESSPSDMSLEITASSPSNFGFNPRAFLPRAAPAAASSTSTTLAVTRTPSIRSHLSLSVSKITQMSSSSNSAPPASPPGTTRPEKKSKSKSPKVGPKLALHGARSPITSAVWWLRQSATPENESGVSTSKIRRMEGEILLPKDLVPSFEFGGFRVKYAIALLPFQAPGFELLSAVSPSSSASPPASAALALTSEPLLLTRIEIATLPASNPSIVIGSGTGSAPRSRAPPEVDAQAQRAAHAERVRKPMVWGLFNQFVNGSGPGNKDGLT